MQAIYGISVTPNLVRYHKHRYFIKTLGNDGKQLYHSMYHGKLYVLYDISTLFFIIISNHEETDFAENYYYKLNQIFLSAVNLKPCQQSKQKIYKNL